LKIEFKPVKMEEIKARGRYREEVKACVKNFLQLIEQGIKAVESNEFSNRKLAMSYYDSFDNYIKKEKLPIQVKIRTEQNGMFKLFLVKKE